MSNYTHILTDDQLDDAIRYDQLRDIEQLIDKMREYLDSDMQREALQQHVIRRIDAIQAIINETRSR